MRKKELNDLYNFKFSWTKTPKFYKSNSISNLKEVCENLFVCVGNTSQHQIWLIQEILEFYKVDLTKCTLLIRVHPKGEPEYIRKIVHDYMERKFADFLRNDESKDEKIVPSYLAAIKILNKVLITLNTSFDDLYLIDELLSLTNYKLKAIERLKFFKNISEKQLNFIILAGLEYSHFANKFFKLNYIDLAEKIIEEKYSKKFNKAIA